VARVSDFGLARAGNDDDSSSSSGERAAAVEEAASSFDTPLTESGAILGTPAYMAPEQHRGQLAGEAADQFSFCVSLYEALYGERPFVDDAPEGVGRRQALAGHVLAGRIKEPPRGSHVPAWLRKILVRGLSVEARDRYPSMEVLLAELARDPDRPRRRLLAAAAAVLVAGAGVVITLLVVPHARPCTGGPRLLQPVWNASVRERVRSAFLATGKPYARAAFDGVAAALDRRAEAYLGGFQEACEATQVRKEQSAAVLDLRMACLEDRLRETGAFVEMLTTADADLVQRARRAVDGLGDLSSCADAAALGRMVAPPADPETRRRVTDVRGLVGEASARDLAGRYADGVARA
jgi:hypothetical protein